jgi:type IV secretory pathway VirB10-like protein
MADDKERETQRTTVVRSDGDGRSSAAIVIAVIALLIVALAVVFFSGILQRNNNQDLNVELNQPGVNVIVPDTQLPPLTTPEVQSPPPDVNINVTTPPPQLPEENVGNSVITNSG